MHVTARHARTPCDRGARGSRPRYSRHTQCSQRPRSGSGEPTTTIADAAGRVERSRRAAQPPCTERVRLGRWLFYDTRLSADGTVSCATCHLPARAFSNGDASHWVRVDTPGFAKRHRSSTWRTHSCEPVRLGRPRRLAGGAVPAAGREPRRNGNTASRMVGTLTASPGYAPYFQRAFGDRAITPGRVASALADYQRTRISGNSAWDRWERGDAGALSPSARRGWDLFPAMHTAAAATSVRT